MYSLTENLAMASQSLSADTGALAVINNNISNANTTGYSRETVNLSAEALDTGASSQLNGVSFNGYTSVRDQVLQISINQTTAQLASANSQSASWSQIESAFSTTTGDVGSSLSNFFSALSSLSTAPTDDGTRQAAYTAASQVVTAFHQAASALSSAQASADQSASQTVEQINQLTAQIGSLDGQLAGLQASGQQGGAIQDQRDALTTQLAQLIGVSSTNTETTPSLSAANGSPLVIGDKSYALSAGVGANGQTSVFDAEGNDIKSQISGGSLGGALTMRDTSIPQLTQTLNNLATQFASAMNQAQSMGYDLSGHAGTAMFAVPADGSSAAAELTLVLPAASGLATSSDGSAGSSGNLTNLLAVSTQNLPSGQTPSNTYAALTQAIGTSSAEASSQASAATGALQQMTSQQSSESGVSIDEETTNLLRFQQAYSASAEVITALNNLFSIVLNMNTVTG